jgi:hypothetical protein
LPVGQFLHIALEPFAIPGSMLRTVPE